jgi:pyrroloquinoline quinone (PQQ) biosynthesis protein C
MTTSPVTADVAEFVDELMAETRARKVSLLDGEFLAALEARSIRREQIGEWAKVFYAATKNGRLGLGSYYANSPDDPDLRRELAENIYEEETGRISGVNKCHMDVFLDLLWAFGITEERAQHLMSPLGDYMPQGRAISADDFYVELTTYGLSVETPNAEWCARMHVALRDGYGFNDDETRWFSMHAMLDAEHGDEFKAHAAQAAQAPNGLPRLREQTLLMSEVVRDVWNGFGVWKNAG